MLKPRDNLTKKYSRCHYNKLGKSKQTFDSVEDALYYIDKYKLIGYNIYKCNYCNKYHYGRN